MALPGGPAARYAIRVEGHLDDHWSASFRGMALVHHDDGTTTIVGPVTDQAELHGVLARIRDLGVPLLSVRSVAGPGPVAGGRTATYRDGDRIRRGGDR